MGDMLGTVKGLLVNFVVRQRQEDGAAPGRCLAACAFNARAGRGRRRLTLKPVDVGPDDIAFLQYTGGTTGVSKGATLLHRNMVANVVQLSVWLERRHALAERPEDQVVRLRAAAVSHLRADGELR